MFVDYFVVAENLSETEILIYFHAWPLQVMILNAISLWVTKLKIFAKLPFFEKVNQYVSKQLSLLDNDICLIEQLHVSTQLVLLQAPTDILFFNVSKKFVHNMQVYLVCLRAKCFTPSSIVRKLSQNYNDYVGLQNLSDHCFTPY
jgi:hypothetical protein